MNSTQPEVLARLRRVPCGPCVPTSYTMTLVKLSDQRCRLDVVREGGLGDRPQRWRVEVRGGDVERHLAALQRSTVPAFPISPPVLDGQWVELMVQGTCSTLTLSWWTLAPDGAEAFAAFAHWIQQLAFDHQPAAAGDASRG